MGYQHTGAAFLFDQSEHQIKNIRGGGRIEIASRFVGQKQGWGMHQSAGNCHPLTFSCRQVARPRRGAMRKPNLIQQSCSPVGPIPFRNGVGKAEANADIFFGAEVR